MSIMPAYPVISNVVQLMKAIIDARGRGKGGGGGQGGGGSLMRLKGYTRSAGKPNAPTNVPMRITIAVCTEKHYLLQPMS